MTTEKALQNVTACPHCSGTKFRKFRPFRLMFEDRGKISVFIAQIYGAFRIRCAKCLTTVATPRCEPRTPDCGACKRSGHCNFSK